MTKTDEKLLDQKFGRIHDKLDQLLGLEDRVKDLERGKWIRRGFSIALTFVVTILTIVTLFESL